MKTAYISIINLIFYEIIFVGAAKGERRWFIEKFQEWGVPNHQTIIQSPPKDEEEIKRWLCEADLAIVPSGEQEFGMFGLIALSSGLPILVHGASGLVESEDFIEWSKAIKMVRDKVRTVWLEEADLLQKDYNKIYTVGRNGVELLLRRCRRWLLVWISFMWLACVG